MDDFWETLLDDIEKGEIGIWKRKITPKSKSVIRSNSVHDRLVFKHNRDDNLELVRYHAAIIRQQCDEDRILSMPERKAIYKRFVKQQYSAPRVKGKGRKDER